MVRRPRTHDALDAKDRVEALLDEDSLPFVHVADHGVLVGGADDLLARLAAPKRAAHVFDDGGARRAFPASDALHLSLRASCGAGIGGIGARGVGIRRGAALTFEVVLHLVVVALIHGTDSKLELFWLGIGLHLERGRPRPETPVLQPGPVGELVEHVGPVDGVDERLSAENEYGAPRLDVAAGGWAQLAPLFLRHLSGSREMRSVRPERPLHPRCRPSPPPSFGTNIHARPFADDRRSTAQAGEAARKTGGAGGR